MMGQHKQRLPPLPGRARSLPARALAMAMLAAGLAAGGPGPAAQAAVDTPHLTVSDATGTLSAAELGRLAGHAEAALERVLAFWSADCGTDRFGRIAIVFDAPRRGAYTSVFYWEPINGRRARVVRVFGFAETPQMLEHKLTSAVFPQKDKLIRNLMGVLVDAKIGNPLTFPLCGLAADDWVGALIEAKAYVPLAGLGADHEAWGMKMAPGGQVSVFDRVRQHVSYAEAASFGEFLFSTYGIEGLKRLQRLSQGRERPYREAFGADLADLEANWLAALAARRAEHEGPVALAAALWKADPANACAAAQRRAHGPR
jgi:hypothetical protein